jgi:ABC-type sugar transport system substrate-binding protein
MSSRLSRRKFLGVASAAVAVPALTGVLAACQPAAPAAGSSRSGAAASGFGPKRKLIWVPQAAGDWELPIRVGCIDFCKMVGWDFQYLGNPQYSVENHLEEINKAIAAKADVIVTCLESQGLVSAFQKAMAAGIVMVISNQGNLDAAKSLNLGMITEDGIATGVINGTQAAQWGQKLTGKKEGLVLIGSGNPGSATIDLRQKGTENGVAAYNKANGTNFTTEMFPDGAFDDIPTSVGKYGAQWDQKGDKIVAMVGLGGNSAMAIWKMMQDRNIPAGKFAVGSHDAFPDLFKGIDAGYIQWCIELNFYFQGYLAAAQAWSQLERKYAYRGVDTGGEAINKGDTARALERNNLYLAKAKDYGLTK